MVKRKLENHKECLVSFSKSLKKQISSDLHIWKKINPEQAQARSFAYASVIYLLKKQAEESEVSFVDLGLVDYKVPNLIDLEE